MEPKIVKRLTNYPELIYNLSKAFATGDFSFRDYISYIKRYDQKYCSSAQDKLLRVTTELGAGFFGQTGKISLCNANSLCAELKELCVSWDEHWNFHIFSQDTVKKSFVRPKDPKFSTIVPTFIVNEDGETIEATYNLEEIPNLIMLSEREMETITTMLADIIYDSGQNPHIVKTFGIYPCTSVNDEETLDIIMELADSGNLAAFISKDTPASLIDSFIVQSMMASFSLYYHGGILHNDTHLGNHFLTKFSRDEPRQGFYCGQDLHRKRYLHYKDLDPNIFGAKDLFVDTHDILLKLGDYGFVVADLLKANNPYLSRNVKILSLGEQSSDLDVANDISLRRFVDPEFQGYGVNDIFANITFNYLQGYDSSGPLFFFLKLLLRQLRKTKNPYARQLHQRLEKVFAPLGVDMQVFSSDPSARGGRGPYENFIGPMLKEFAKIGHGVLYVGRKDSSKNSLKTESIDVYWQGVFTDPIFRSISSYQNFYESCIIRNSLECPELRLEKIQRDPQTSYKDNYVLDEEILPETSVAQFKIYRDYPSLLYPESKGFYLSSTYNPETKPWSQSLENQLLRGMYSVLVRPIMRDGKVNLSLNYGMTLLNSVETVPGEALAVNGNYFLVALNLENALHNIERNSQYGDPLGLSYNSDTDREFVNPFPPIYQPYLVYIGINFDGKHFIFSHQEMIKLSGKDTTMTTFTYAVPGQINSTFTRTLKIPNLRKVAREKQLRYIYQSGPVLLSMKNGGINYIFQEREYERQFVITEKDVDSFVESYPPENPRNFLGKNYGVYAKNVGDKLQIPEDYSLFSRHDKRTPTLYGMSHSSTFMNHNVLFIYKDGSFSFLLVSGRGYGSEGIDRAQLAEKILQIPELTDNLVAAISLDGGFSANALIKFPIEEDDEGKYAYLLEDPERRMVGISYLIN